MTDTTREGQARFAGTDWVDRASYEALLTRAEAAEAERDRQYDENVHRIMEQAKAESERDALQAKLALAVEALSSAADDLDDYSPLTGNTIETTASRSARAARAQLTADTIPDPRIEGWNAAIEAAAEVYEGYFDRLARLIRTIPCPYAPKEGKDYE